MFWNLDIFIACKATYLDQLFLSDTMESGILNIFHYAYPLSITGFIENL